MRLDAASERQRGVLQRRFGLGGAPQQSLADIGRELGISRERARQLQEEGLKRLRRLSQAADAQEDGAGDLSPGPRARG